MKVILKKEVKTLGKSGEVVEVSEGYANNFLFPRQLAVVATDGAIKDKADKDRTQAIKEQKELEQMQELAKTIGAKPIVIKSKVGSEGKLYGTVTTKEIAQAMKEQIGFEFDKRKIGLDDPIKSVGIYEIELQLHAKVKAKIHVEVQGQASGAT
ncbi:MAG: 50S ribosomal protein L9 [Candidatus Sericytochromatia bacterium]|nr:50S ribosomal protein L9 [Candidatus Sericytochromatia bacterium]